LKLYEIQQTNSFANLAILNPNPAQAFISKQTIT